MAPLESRFVAVGGLDVHVRVGGEGAPVVLLHGLGVSNAYFVPLGEELASGLRVFAPSLPGFGESEHPPRVPGIAALAGALAGTLDALELDRVPLVANSLGCQIAVELAGRAPDRVSGLVLTGPTVDPRRRSAVQQTANILLDCFREPASLLPIIVRDYARFGLRRLAATGSAALHDPIEEKLPRIQVPTLVVRGERDPLVTQRWCEEAAALLPRGRLAVIRGNAHACNYSAPGETAELVRGLLEELD